MSLQRKKPLRSRSPIKQGGTPIRPKKRKPSEFARIYGSKARVAFVKSLPCSACGVVGYSQNAHVLGNGGMSRKADANTIAPLCGPRLTAYHGCHFYFDEKPRLFNVMFPGFDAERAASFTESAWLAASQGTPTRRTTEP